MLGGYGVVDALELLRKRHCEQGFASGAAQKKLQMMRGPSFLHKARWACSRALLSTQPTRKGPLERQQ